MASVERKTWDDFSKAGLLWWVNRILHTFGWSIVIEADEETGAISDVYPARTTWLGYPPEEDDDGFNDFREHIRTARTVFEDPADESPSPLVGKVDADVVVVVEGSIERIDL